MNKGCSMFSMSKAAVVCAPTVFIKRIFGVRRQSAAATALSCAPDGHESFRVSRAGESGVALRFPPHSKWAMEFMQG
jgi:hypothetical protein